jgi:hypothetical protein
MFILAALLSLGGVSYMHWFVRDPRHTGTDYGRAQARP